MLVLQNSCVLQAFSYVCSCHCTPGVCRGTIVLTSAVGNERVKKWHNLPKVTGEVCRHSFTGILSSVIANGQQMGFSQWFASSFLYFNDYVPVQSLGIVCGSWWEKACALRSGSIIHLNCFIFIMESHLWQCTELNMMSLGSCRWYSSCVPHGVFFSTIPVFFQGLC